jgi:hypothetical protein
MPAGDLITQLDANQSKAIHLDPSIFGQINAGDGRDAL